MNDVTFVVATSTELEVAVMEYGIALRQSGAAPTTVKNYEWHINRLLVWLQERGVDNPGSVTRAMLREWGAGLYENWQSATIRQAVSACRSLFKWCHEEGLVETNPSLVLKRPKEQKKVNRTLSADEVGRMIEVCDITTTKGIRDRAIISMLFDSGLRAAELCRLRLLDVDLKERRLKVVVKGGNEMPGYFGETTAERCRAWLRTRMVAPGISSFFVAVGGMNPGFPLTKSGLFRILRNIGNKAGVPGVSVHAFRRAFAVHLTLNNVPNSVLQDLGRWEDVKMIKRYTAALHAEEVYRGRSPVDDISGK